MTTRAASPRRTAMRVLAWGKTSSDTELAVELAAVGPGRVDWEFVAVARASRMPCPLDLNDPKAVAVGQDPTAAHAWAYVVYQADRADG